MARGFSFADIDRWTGSGPHRAALVIDWNDDREGLPIVWGYRFADQVSAGQMLLDVLDADPKLYLRIGLGGSWGMSLYGIGYDRNLNGFAIDDGTVFVDRLAVTGPADGAMALDPIDVYREGWFDGFWAYFIGLGGSPYGSGQWQVAGTGMSGRMLTNGEWAGLRFSEDETLPPTVPFSSRRLANSEMVPLRPHPSFIVPEPNRVWLLLIVSTLAAANVLRLRSPFPKGRAFAMCLVVAGAASAADVAVEVVDYEPGTGISAAYTNPLAALGEPTRITGPANPFGGVVTPFQSPFEPDEIVSIGFGGYLTLAFDRPVWDRPTHVNFGVDLIVYGNAFFLDADYPNGVVAGLIAEPGIIEVSQDLNSWVLVPSLADTMFPTMGYQDVLEPFATTEGTVPADFYRTVNPNINPMGMTMAELITAYDGAGGGVGVDISSTGLSWIQYIRISNTNDPASGLTPDIDAVTIVVPEPQVVCWLVTAIAVRNIRRRDRYFR